MMVRNPDFADLLAESLGEAVAHRRGTLDGVKVTRVPATTRSAAVSPPPVYDAARIRAIRTRLKVSQPIFASLLNVSGATVRAWEQGARIPDGATRRLLEVADLHPEALTGTLHPRVRSA